jgi:hypothetical protein
MNFEQLKPGAGGLGTGDGGQEMVAAKPLVAPDLHLEIKVEGKEPRKMVAICRACNHDRCTARYSPEHILLVDADDPRVTGAADTQIHNPNTKEVVKQGQKRCGCI